MTVELSMKKPEDLFAVYSAEPNNFMFWDPGFLLRHIGLS